MADLTFKVHKITPRPHIYIYHDLTTNSKMTKKAAVPDAWDDDWESQADKADEEAESAKLEEQVKVTKSQRLAMHAETNKKIWDSA